MTKYKKNIITYLYMFFSWSNRLKEPQKCSWTPPSSGRSAVQTALLQRHGSQTWGAMGPWDMVFMDINCTPMVFISKTHPTERVICFPVFHDCLPDVTEPKKHGNTKFQKSPCSSQGVFPTTKPTSCCSPVLFQLTKLLARCCSAPRRLIRGAPSAIAWSSKLAIESGQLWLFPTSLGFRDTDCHKNHQTPLASGVFKSCRPWTRFISDLWPSWFLGDCRTRQCDAVATPKRLMLWNRVGSHLCKNKTNRNKVWSIFPRHRPIFGQFFSLVPCHAANLNCEQEWSPASVKWCEAIDIDAGWRIGLIFHHAKNTYFVVFHPGFPPRSPSLNWSLKATYDYNSPSHISSLG